MLTVTHFVVASRIPDENWNISDIPTHELVHDVVDQTTPIYVDYLRGSLHEDVLADNKKYAIDVVYSAMHGTGYRYIADAFKGCNLKVRSICTRYLY